MLKRLSIVAVILTMMFMVVGCGGSQPTTGDTKKEDKAAADKKITVGVVLKASNSDYWKIVTAGAEQAGKDLGVDVKVMGPNAETDITGQVSMIEDQITKKVSALVVAPSQPSSAIPIFDKAKAANIPVILADTDAPWDSKVSFVGTGNLAGGKMGGEYLAKKLGKGAKVVIIRGALGDSTHDERANGAKEALEAAGVQIISIQPANSDRAMAMSVMENILQANPNVQGVFATNDEMALGALQALAAKKMQIPVVGFDGSPDALKSIAEGKLDASVAQSPFNIGKMSVEAAVKAAKGETVEKRIDTGTEIINKDNVAQKQAELDKILKK
ncbi:sugar ABC transporter substrate-binding protein [Desulfotomaculum nigrificans]|uniref:sugar ABC transporter substrate-binding protein n=1 Tax=Desulfotomaculum nigrificans TaxID=1565 RepID=UPI0001FAEC95|nr:sugar ABC transporter substrate-binding protein [Desulfotomaculum nigrificans]